MSEEDTRAQLLIAALEALEHDQVVADFVHHHAHSLFDLLLPKRQTRRGDYELSEGDTLVCGDVEVTVHAWDYVDPSAATAPEVACVLSAAGVDTDIVPDKGVWQKVVDKQGRPVVRRKS